MQSSDEFYETKPINLDEFERLSWEFWDHTLSERESLEPEVHYSQDGWGRFLETNPVGMTTHEAGRQFYELGFNPIPMKGYSATPAFSEWSYYHATRLQWSVLDQALPGNNLAVVTGRTSLNLFVIECFGDHSYQELVTKLGEWAKWTVQTPNSYQIWLLSKDGEIKNSDHRAEIALRQEEAWKGQYRVLGNRSFVLVPPSVGEDGSLYLWTKREGNLPPEISQAELHVRIPGIWLRHVPRPRQDNNQEEVPTIGKYWNILNKPDVAALIEWSNSHPWRGRSGSTDRTIFIWCCATAANLSIDDFHFSIREMALLSGVQEKTVHESLKRLSSGGLIRRLGRDGLRGSRYQILVDINNYPTVGSVNNISGVVIDGFANHEAWHAWALGKGGKQIYDFLHELAHDGPGLSFEDLVEGTGKVPATVKSHLQRLSLHGLVYLEDGKWKAADANLEKLDGVARFYQTNGANERKAQRYQKERRQYAGRLIQHSSDQDQ